MFPLKNSRCHFGVISFRRKNHFYNNLL
jgi:hypothetical protein